MDGSGFGRLFDGLVKWVVICFVLIAGLSFALGYGCASCKYRPHFEIRKIK